MHKITCYKILSLILSFGLFGIVSFSPPNGVNKDCQKAINSYESLVKNISQKGLFDYSINYQSRMKWDKSGKKVFKYKKRRYEFIENLEKCCDIKLTTVDSLDLYLVEFENLAAIESWIKYNCQDCIGIDTLHFISQKEYQFYDSLSFTPYFYEDGN